MASRFTRKTVSSSLFTAAATVLVSAGLVVVGGGTSTPAAAADPFDCSLVYSQQGAFDHDIREVDTANGDVTEIGNFTGAQGITTTRGNMNALGISADGSESFTVIAGENGTERYVYIHTRSNLLTGRYVQGPNNTKITHGAVNPRTGVYYWGGLNNDGTLNIYAAGEAGTFNRPTSFGLVATGKVPFGGTNGDFAFDTDGNLYVISGGKDPGDVSVLSVITQSLPTSAVGTPLALTANELVRVPTDTNPINGIAFAGDGFMYMSTMTSLFKANPSTGALIGAEQTLSEGGNFDLRRVPAPTRSQCRRTSPKAGSNRGTRPL